MHILSRALGCLIGRRQAREPDPFPGRKQFRHGKLHELARRQGPDMVFVLRGPLLFGATNGALYLLFHGGLLEVKSDQPVCM